MSKREKVIIPKALLPAGTFPHNARFFSAEIFHNIVKVSEKTFLWVGIVTLTFVNMSIVRPSITSSLASRFHLSQNYSKLTILFGKFANASVLGATDSQRQLREERSSKERERAYWQQVISIHPDYRDAYIRLITLSYELGHPQETSLYVEKLRELSPNEAFLQKISGLLEQQ